MWEEITFLTAGNVLPRYPCHAWHKAHLLENRTCQEVVRKQGSCLSYQMMTTESGEMWWDFQVFGGKEARLDGQLQLVTEGKESVHSWICGWSIWKMAVATEQHGKQLI